MTHWGLIFPWNKAVAFLEQWKGHQITPDSVSAQEETSGCVRLWCFICKSLLCSFLAVMITRIRIRFTTSPKIPMLWLMCDSKKLSKMDTRKGMNHMAGPGMLIFLYHVIILFIWTFSELDYYFLSCNSKLRATRTLTDWVHTFITKIQKLQLFDMEMGHQEKQAHSLSQWHLKTLEGLRTERILFHTSLTVLSNILLSNFWK